MDDFFNSAPEKAIVWTGTIQTNFTEDAPLESVKKM